jgi:hypothetical protein
MNFMVKIAAATAGTRVAAAAGKYGIIGTAAGLLVTSAVLRWPGKAFLLGAGFAARKLWLQQNKPVALLEHRPASRDTVALEQPLQSLA